MGTDEKMILETIDSLVQRAADIQQSLKEFLMKLEYDGALDWHSMVESYSVLVSQVSSLFSIMKSDRCPQLQNYSLLPLNLSIVPDDELLRVTEGRLSMFNHEFAPLYLNTRPVNDVMQQDRALRTSATGATSGRTVDAIEKHITTLNNRCSTILENFQSRQDTAADPNMTVESTFNASDTLALVAATEFGVGIRQPRPQTSSGVMVPGGPVPGGSMPPQMGAVGQPLGQPRYGPGMPPHGMPQQQPSIRPRNVMVSQAGGPYQQQPM